VEINLQTQNRTCIDWLKPENHDNSRALKKTVFWPIITTKSSMDGEREIF
jgi:hypothetical protein